MMSDTLSKDDRWAIGQALEILFFAGKTEKQCKAINNLLDLVDRQTYKLHKADGMANEVNILTKENRELTAERDEYRDACERLIGHYGNRDNWGDESGHNDIFSVRPDENGYDFARQVKAELEAE